MVPSTTLDSRSRNSGATLSSRLYISKANHRVDIHASAMEIVRTTKREIREHYDFKEAF